ncbi:MAG: hypothetical protein LBH14_07455 [Desulfobulbaceae bacterium]|jgi:hypothetical protein|nr:hypothetical protein [Desulfobulbaceae bacterium]
MVSPRTLLLLILACAAFPAAARVYCCTDDSGRRVCGDILPVQCQTRAYDELTVQGAVKRKFSAPLTIEQRVQHEAELARQKAAEREAAEQARRDKAIMVSYSSIADIETKRDQTLAAAQMEIDAAQERLAAAQDRQESLRQRAAQYADGKMPDILKANLHDIAAEIVARQATLEASKKNLGAVQERFDRDRRRYLELTGKDAAASLPTETAATMP